MFTIKNTSVPILFDYLEKIVVDDPSVSIKDDSIVLSDKLLEELNNVIENGEISGDFFEWRKCTSGCFCKKNYLSLNDSELKRLFLRKCNEPI